MYLYNKPKNLPIKNNKMQELKIVPLSFKENDFIPKDYTCDGKNTFPSFELKFIPKNTKSIIMMVEDPDAPMERPFIHVMAVNIPANNFVDENTLKKSVLWTNYFGKLGWGGPCPPHSHGVHHYHFKFFALKNTLPLKNGFSLNDFIYTLNNQKADILASWEVIGLYKR